MLGTSLPDLASLSVGWISLRSMRPETPPPPDDTTRRTAQKLFDLAALFDEETNSMPPGSFETVMVELAELGAVTALIDDDPNVPITVDVNPLLGAIGFLMGLLINYIVEQTGHDRLAVISTLRSVVDDSH